MTVNTTTTEIYKMFVGVSFVSEGKITGTTTAILGQVVTKRNICFFVINYKVIMMMSCQLMVEKRLSICEEVSICVPL
jgi:hypothetical protein